ncbi:mRNA decay protein [Plasmodium gonderi]|uniref:mRNA decay protein n=1 Tax=Plasmodium gonderi TaxID=77519 RepID=A0A1Y1JLE6_PLAGO|nr:mRNA decay protein [Plasmodium gonderi]GAW82285.1 mRNA decay protein [Plasmodium gonderi]
MYSSGVRPYKILQKVKVNENKDKHKKEPSEASKEPTKREDYSKKNTSERKKKYEDIKYYECNRKFINSKKQEAEGHDKITKNKTNYNINSNSYSEKYNKEHLRHDEKSRNENLLKQKENILISLLKKEQSCVNKKKIIIRHLPPTLSEDNFFDSFSTNLKDELDYYYYVNGSIPKNPADDIIYSRMYLSFKDDLKTKEFIKTQHGKFFYDLNGVKYKALVSFAPYQTLIHKNKSDDMNNTLESDDYFLKFCEEMNNQEESVKRDAKMM